jgi:hypothetical protein
MASSYSNTVPMNGPIRHPRGCPAHGRGRGVRRRTRLIAPPIPVRSHSILEANGDRGFRQPLVDAKGRGPAPALAEPEARPARRRGSRTDRLASRREEPPASHRFHRVLSAATAGTGAGQPEWDPAICTAIGLTFCEGGVARLAVAWPTTDAAISPHPRHAVARDSI